MEPSNEIFSFHLTKLPFRKVPSFLFGSASKISGLKHSERFLTMNLGASIAMSARYNFTTGAFFARWEDERALDEL